MHTILLIIGAAILIIALEYGMHHYRLRKWKRLQQDDRFNKLFNALKTCETLEDLQELKQSMTFSLNVEDYGDTRFLVLDEERMKLWERLMNLAQ